MADTISAQITQNIKTTLVTLSTYHGTPAAVELERLFLDINDRYPYVEVCDQNAEIETQTFQVADTTLRYIIKYYIDVNDESEVADTEITYLTRNVAGDIIKHLMVDASRGALAQNTKALSYGPGFELSEDNIEFFIYVEIEVQSLIDSKDPYLLG